MTRKLFYFIALLLFSFACEQFVEQQPTGTVTFADGTSFTLQFEAEGGQKSITFNADSNWTVSTSNEWINVSKSSGTKSDTSFKVDIETNDSLEGRDGYIVMYAANNKSYRFDIHQNGEQPSFKINSNGEYEVLAKGGNVSVKLETNLEYTVEIPSSAKSWITLSDTRAIREETLTFIIAANQDFDERKANINIVNKDNSVLKTIVIVQHGEEETFSLNKSSVTVDENGGDFVVEVSTNLDYVVDIPTEAKSWLSLADTRTVRSENLVFTVLPNDTLSAREAIVTITVSNGKKHTVKFTQKAMTLVFEIDTTYVMFDKDGGSVVVAVTSNIDYNIVIDDASWLSYDQTRATTTDTIVFTATTLADGDIRSAEVKFTDVSGNNLAALNVEQDSSFIVAYTTNDGKPVDIYKTEGFGAAYLGNVYNSDSNSGRLRFDAAITAIPAQAFALCTNLTTIDIPNSVTSIGSSAFSGCSAIQEITIPEGVTAVGTDAFVNCSGKAYINCNMDTNWSTYTSLSFENAGFDEVVIGDNVEIIGYHAFTNAKITKLTLGNNVKEIRDWAFGNNFHLKNLVIPDSVTSIGDSAFWGCVDLVSITLGAGLTTINDPCIGSSLYEPSSLMLVYCKSTIPPTATGSIFAKKSNLTIYIPKDSSRDYKTAVCWTEYASCMISYDYENDKVDDPDHSVLPRDKWIGVWDMESSQSMIIKESGDIVIDDTHIKQEISIVPHPSYSEEVLIYGLSAKNYPARAYVDDNGDINLVSGMAVGEASSDGYEPTWLIYAELNNNRGYFTDQMVSYVFKMNGDTATATPVTETLSNGAKLKILSTEVYAVNPNTGKMAYYTSTFPVVYHAGKLSLTRCETRVSKCNSVEPSNLSISYIEGARVSSLEELR